MLEMPPKKTPIRDMTPEQRRAYQNEWYERNKAKVQLARISRQLANGERSVSVRTLEKYNVKPDENEKIVIKPTTKVRYVKEDVEESFEVPKRVYVERPKKISQYEPSDTLNAVEIKRWVETSFKYEPKKLNSDETRADRVITDYFNLPDKLFRIHGVKYDGLKDISNWFNNPKEIIGTIDKQNWAWGTKADLLGKMLQMYHSFPLVKQIMGKKVYDELNEKNVLWKAQAKDSQHEKTANTLIFSYDVIKRAVKNFYGEITEQNLLFQLYDAVIFRDNIASLNLVYSEKEMVDEKANYLLILRPSDDFHSATIYLNSYKTSGVYGQRVFKLPSALTRLINQLYVGKNIKKLFPFEKEKLSEYIIKTLREIPLFAKEAGLGVKYLRHSIISTKLLKLNKNAPNYREETLKLASLSMHSLESQPKYTSPIKNASGKPLKTKEEIEAVENEIEMGQKDKGDQSLIGKKFKRKFKVGIFEGTVMEYVAPFYNILYEDNDTEQLTESELKKLLKKK
jgi:hypothetical protein